MRSPKPQPNITTLALLLASEWLKGGRYCVVPGQRFYSPELGRWMNRDPIGEEGGVNVYQAMAGGPTNFIDAIGKCTISPWPFSLKKHVALEEDPFLAGRGEVKFPITPICDCRCKDAVPAKGSKYGLKCTIAYAGVRIIINPRRNDTGGAREGAIGHEQVHLRNHRRFLLDLRSAVTQCEKHISSTTREACDTAKWDLVTNIGVLYGRFRDKERRHANFVHPQDGQDYAPLTLVGPPTSTMFLFPKKFKYLSPITYAGPDVGYDRLSRPSLVGGDLSSVSRLPSGGVCSRLPFVSATLTVRSS